MKSTASFRPTKFVNRIGRHHFTHLRAVADGIDPGKSALLYLGCEHGLEAITAHRQTVDAVRAIARRSREGSVWRLVGLTIRPKKNDSPNGLESPSQKSAKPKVPTFDEWSQERDLDGWSEEEVLQMYLDQYPATTLEKTEGSRRDKLRERQLQLLARLEVLAVEIPDPSHLVTGWFDDLTATRLVAAGIVSLAHLRRAIQRAGRWYRSMPGIGKGKAERIAAFLDGLLPADPASETPVFALRSLPSPYTAYREIVLHSGTGDLFEPFKPTSILRAESDMDAVKAWVSARAGSGETAKVYFREATRLMLWLQMERSGVGLPTVSIEDCLSYMTFLQNIPSHWISRRKAEPFNVGWAPFRGQLSYDSQQQSIIVIAGLFHWLQSAGYLKSNPWVLVNKRNGDDKHKLVKVSKAISEFGFAEIIRFIDAQQPTHASERMRFVFTFLESVGLRSKEFLDARLEHFELQEEGWVLHVSGKGSKNRFAFIPKQAFDSLQRYLRFRGFAGIDSAPAKIPLLARTTNPLEPVGYQAFYESVKVWTLKAIRASSLSEKEKAHLELASPHWLRHTFGTRSVARDVAMDAIQAQMGHASIKTTMDTYGRAPMKRRASELTKAFG